MIEPRIVSFPFGNRTFRSTLYYGADVRESVRGFPDNSIHCVVTSPPYWGLRDYGTGTWEGGDPNCVHSAGGQVQDSKYDGTITTGQRPGVDAGHCRLCGATRVDDQIGLEQTPEEYVAAMVDVFREVRRVLREDGVLWMNLGDSYTSGGRESRAPDAKDSKGGMENDARPPTPSGLKPKDLVGIPWMVAFALRADGWYLRSDIIWAKGNPMPESVTDRPTRAHEFVFLLSKKPVYYYDQFAVREPVASGAQKPNREPVRDFAKAAESFGAGTSASRRNAAGGFFKEDGLRNQRSVWNINPKPYKGAHFATMPTALAELCIKAGSSEKGCCPTCGSPWKRDVEKAKTGDNLGKRLDNPRAGIRGSGLARPPAGVGGSQSTKGWSPTCDCPEHDPVPCLIFDPFSGSGTTGFVANRMGRNYVGTDLNPDYLPLAEARLMGMDPPEDDDPATESAGDMISIMEMFGSAG